MTPLSEKPELDTSKVAYQLPQPTGMMLDIFLGSALDLDGDERDWVPQSADVSFKPLVLSVSQGYYVNILRVLSSGFLSRHRHTGPVRDLKHLASLIPPFGPCQVSTDLGQPRLQVELLVDTAALPGSLRHPLSGRDPQEVFGLVQDRLQKNVEAMSRIAGSRSVQDFVAVQSDLARDTLQQVIDTNRRVAEVSLRIADEEPPRRILNAPGTGTVTCGTVCGPLLH